MLNPNQTFNCCRYPLVLTKWNHLVQNVSMAFCNQSTDFCLSFGTLKLQELDNPRPCSIPAVNDKLSQQSTDSALLSDLESKIKGQKEETKL